MKVHILLLFQVISSIMAKKRVIPPQPTYRGEFTDEFPKSEIAKQISTWTPKESGNAWEMSGQFEGDIMLSELFDGRNAIQDETRYWTKKIIPVYIYEQDFSEYEVEVIRQAFEEYHDKTCIRFRPYKKGDSDYVVVRSNKPGCWSYVGRHGGGQVVNLQSPGCVHHGIVVHEFLHALGFYHQQSAHNRDEYIVIHWDNIKTGKEHNFRKYNATTVTDYGVGYDYGSIMHYSDHAFSKNGEITIEPLDKSAKLGQRDGLSKKDISKIQKMYGCNQYYGMPDYWPFYKR